MATEKQIAANRENAKKSTGAKTPEGRRNSSRNGTRHGILASVVLLEGESQERFAALVNSLFAEFQPETPTEIALVQTMAVSQWRRTRIWALESSGLTHEMKLQSESVAGENASTRAMLAFKSLGDSGHCLELTSRYESRFDRQYRNALRELTRLIDRRIARATRTQSDEENKGPAQTGEPILTPGEPEK